jgi:hypothetical protein
MAREAVKVELFGANNSGDQIRFTCASNAAITKGTFLKCADLRTASASTGTADFFVGFAAADKSATDYSTTISAWTNGIFKVYASGAITVGHYVKTAVPGNYVMETTVADAIIASTAKIVGYALETAAADETFLIRTII